MARHPKLEAQDFGAVRRIFAHLYPYGKSQSPVDFMAADTVIKTVASGRLSFVFTAEQRGKAVFLKLAKPGFVRDNIPASVFATEELRQYSSVPAIPTYAGKNGTLSYAVPVSLEGVDAETMKLVAGQQVTLSEGVQIDSVSEDLKSLGEAMPALMREVGRLGAKVTRGLRPLIRNKQFLAAGTSDPFGFAALRRLFMDDFKLTQEETYLKTGAVKKAVQARIEAMIPNLSQEDPAAKGFGEGLKQGSMIAMLEYFNQLEARVNESLKQHPAPNVIIHNEVKPANLGAQLDVVSNQWVVTRFFDFDQIAYGTPQNGDKTPAEKDLGRTISFLSFDAKTGEFFAENAKELIAGFLERQPKKLEDAQIDRLQDYIRLGVLTSYPVRSSYLAEELQGHPTDIKLGRLNPTIHREQLRQFDEWVGKHNFSAMVRDLENTPVMEAHRKVTQVEDGLFRSYACQTLRGKAGAMEAMAYAVDAAHNRVEGKEGANLQFAAAKKQVMDAVAKDFFTRHALEKVFATLAVDVQKGVGR